MNELEKKLAAEMLLLSADEFSDHTCNDVSEIVWRDWTLEQRQQLIKEYHEYNGDPEEYDPEYLHLPDYILMRFLAHKLRKS